MGTVYPEHQAIYVGALLYIRCNSSTKPTWQYPSVTSSYKPDIDYIEKGNQSYSVIIVLEAVQAHTGIYTCSGSLPEGQSFDIAATVYVTGRDRLCCNLKEKLASRK